MSDRVFFLNYESHFDVKEDISYNAAYQRASQNWLWSVGDSPLSDISSQHHFSLIHKDIASRNMVVSSLHRSLHLLNEGTFFFSMICRFRCPIKILNLSFR